MRYSFFESMPRPARPLPDTYLLALRRFLLEATLPEFGNRPLFDTQTDLARAIQSFEDPSPSLPSLISMVQQGLTGKRRFKPEREVALRKAVVRRIEERSPARLTELTNEFEYCFLHLEKGRNIPFETNVGKSIRKIPDFGAIFVITPYVSSVSESKGGRNLFQTFVIGYGLAGLEVPADRRTRHLIAFPGGADMLTFLVSVVTEAIYEEHGTRQLPFREDRVKKVLDRLASEERRGALRFAVLPPSLCLVAVTVYNCEKEDGQTTVLAYGGNEPFQTLNLYGQFRQGYRKLYHDLMEGQIEGARFLKTAEFHEQIMYQLISPSAVV